MVTGITVSEKDLTGTRKWESETKNIIDILDLGDKDICDFEFDASHRWYNYRCGLTVSATLISEGVAIRDRKGRYQPTGLLRSIHADHHTAFPNNDRPWTLTLTVDDNNHWTEVKGDLI